MFYYNIKSLKKQKMNIALSSNHKDIKYLAKKIFTHNKENQPITHNHSLLKINNLQTRNSSIEWLYRAQLNLNFSRGTLFIAIGIIDQLLSKNIHFLDANQEILTAVVLLICTKFNEVYPPTIRKINMVCADQYSLQQFQEIQAKILEKLNFTINPDEIYMDLAQFQAKYQGRTIEIVKQTIKTALLHPFETFKYGKSHLIQGLACYLNGGIFQRTSNRQNQAMEVVQIRKQLTRLRSASLKRLVSPSKH